MEYETIELLQGKTFNRVYEGIIKNGYSDGNPAIYFIHDDPKQSVIMYHDQDCCEMVSIDDINGELGVLAGVPIILAETAWTGDIPDGLDQGRYEYDDSECWTFYRFRTEKGDVDIRWYGASNGYYSESVEVKLLSDNRD